MANDSERECVEMNKSSEGHRKTEKGKGSYDSKKDTGSVDLKAGYPGKNRTGSGRYGNVKFD